MLSALMMLRRFAVAMRYALRGEDFLRHCARRGLEPGGCLYVAVATLTTSSILDPKLTITDPWLKIFLAIYVLVGIGILVEIARRLGMASSRHERRPAPAADVVRRSTQGVHDRT